MARSLANPAMASSLFINAGGYFHSMGEGRLHGVLGSEKGSELAGTLVACHCLFGGTLPPFHLERNLL